MDASELIEFKQHYYICTQNYLIAFLFENNNLKFCIFCSFIVQYKLYANVKNEIRHVFVVDNYLLLSFYMRKSSIELNGIWSTILIFWDFVDYFLTN